MRGQHRPENFEKWIFLKKKGVSVLTLSNPFCTHCSKAHTVLDDLLSIKADIKLQLVFITRTNAKDMDQKVTGHFIALKSDKNETKLQEAITEWYKQEKKNYELWKKDYPVTEPVIEFDALLKQKEWCRMTGINSTPTIFINGRRLPKVYQPDDLKYIL
jgi:glutaredoxin